jgi:predicted RNase H-like HicB family nuclease
MNKYAIFIAPTTTGYSAYVPDLPGCVAAGKTRDETLRLMQGAIELHLRAMREDGDVVPEPSVVEFMGVA